MMKYACSCLTFKYDSLLRYSIYNIKNIYMIKKVNFSKSNNEFPPLHDTPTITTKRHDPNTIYDEDISTYYSTRDDVLKFIFDTCYKLVLYSITAVSLIFMVGLESFEEKINYIRKEITFEKFAPYNIVKYQHEKILRIYDYRESLRLNHIEKMKKRIERREKLRLWKRKWKYNLGLLKERPQNKHPNDVLPTLKSL